MGVAAHHLDLCGHRRRGAQHHGQKYRRHQGDRDAAPSFERMVEHLKANEVDVMKDKMTIGPVLKMNPKTERFIGNAEADKQLTREYRKPFVVPAIS